MTAGISSLLRGVALLFGVGALAGCSSTHHAQRYASVGQQTNSGYFPQRIYGAASPRVVADGEDVPIGGGRYQVGKPYKIAGRTYFPSEKPVVQTGSASWYGSDFHGRRTANGEVFDLNSISAAHPTMPLPSYARVTNLKNSHSIIVRVNDRGPYHGGRVMDVSQRVAEALDFHSEGTAKVKVEWIGRADLAGDDPRKLMATLRNDGSVAQLEGFETPAATMTAEAEAPAPSEPSRKSAKAKKTIAPEGAPTRLASRTEKLDESMSAYAPTQRAGDYPAETVVTPTPREEVAAPAKPTPLDGQETARVDETPVSTVKPRDTLAPLPPARPGKAAGKQAAARDAIGQLLK